MKVLDQGNNHPDGNAVVEVAGSKTYKTWKKYTEFKMAFHQCVAQLYMGIHSEEMQKMGERLAYFQVKSYQVKILVSASDHNETLFFIPGRDG